MELPRFGPVSGGPERPLTNEFHLSSGGFKPKPGLHVNKITICTGQKLFRPNRKFSFPSAFFPLRIPACPNQPIKSEPPETRQASPSRRRQPRLASLSAPSKNSKPVAGRRRPAQSSRLSRRSTQPAHEINPRTPDPPPQRRVRRCPAARPWIRPIHPPCKITYRRLARFMKLLILLAIFAFAVWAENHCSFDIEQILTLTLP